MAFKFAVFVALLAAVNAGGPASYDIYAPSGDHQSYGFSQESTQKDYGGQKVISSYTKSDDSDHSSVRVSSRLVNNGISLGHELKHLQLDEPLIKSPPLLSKHYLGTPILDKSYAEPTLIKTYSEPTLIKTYAEPHFIKSYPDAHFIKSYPEPALIKSYHEPALIKSYHEPALVKTYPETTILKYPEPTILKSYPESTLLKGYHGSSLLKSYPTLTKTYEYAPHAPIISKDYEYIAKTPIISKTFQYGHGSLLKTPLITKHAPLITKTIETPLITKTPELILPHHGPTYEYSAHLPTTYESHPPISHTPYNGLGGAYPW